MIVLDASAALDLLLRTRTGESIWSLLLETRPSLHAPHVLDVEIAHVLRHYTRAGELAASRAAAALEDLADLRLTRYDHRPLLPRIWALRDNLTAYDAAYVALAEALEAPLLTRDERLANAPGHQAEITLV